MAGYPISVEEFLGTPATAAEAASDAGFALQGIHAAYSAADKLQNVTGYTRDMAYKSLDAIRLTIEDDMRDIPPDPSTPVDELAVLWWEPLQRDILMGWQTVKQVREKAGESVSMTDYVIGLAKELPEVATGITQGAANAAAPLLKPAFEGTIVMLVVVGLLLYLLFRTPALTALGSSLGGLL